MRAAKSDRNPSGAASPAPPISRKFRVDELKDGEEGLIEATEAERASIAELLDLIDLSKLSLSYRFQQLGGGRLTLCGELAARATQTCVVSMEPVPASLNLPVQVEFWPAALIRKDWDAKADVTHHAELDWPEPIEDGVVDLGLILYETLATGLDPYPRAEGAAFHWAEVEAQESGQGAAKVQGPFAALARLKTRKSR
jgi:hypothetical protein